MSKFLLTVCAFGLLSSSAFAEEKSPEQHQEESNQIGLQKMNWTRVVASGTNQRIGFFYAVNPDCSASGDINIRVTKQPEHGTAEIAAASSFPNFERENIRYRCNQHEVRGQQLNYKSAEKYIGSDTLDLLVLLPGGQTDEVFGTHRQATAGVSKRAQQADAQAAPEGDALNGQVRVRCSFSF